MHNAALDFVRRVRAQHPQYFQGIAVLEIGSQNVNGSARYFFDARRYIGVDLAPGLGVDYVANGADLDLDCESWDVVYSCESLEHDSRWLETYRNMVRHGRSGALIFFTCAGAGRAEHGTRRTSPESSPFTLDYYGNRAAEDFDTSAFQAFEFEVNEQHHDLYFWGLKHGDLLGGSNRE